MNRMSSIYITSSAVLQAEIVDPKLPTCNHIIGVQPREFCTDGVCHLHRIWWPRFVDEQSVSYPARWLEIGGSVSYVVGLILFILFPAIMIARRVLYSHVAVRKFMDAREELAGYGIWPIPAHRFILDRISSHYSLGWPCLYVGSVRPIVDRRSMASCDWRCRNHDYCAYGRGG